MGRNIASPLQLSSFNNAVRRQITSPTQVPAHMSSISENDRNFSDTVTECIEERNTIKKDRVVLSSNPLPVSHESHPPLSINPVGNHLIHHTTLPNLPPLLADSQPPPRTHLSLPPHHTDLAQANTNTFSLYQPDPIDISCAMKIKECYLPPCAFNNPVLVIPPPSDRPRRRRVCLPELVRSTSLPGQAVSASAAAAAAALPPSMSQSYHEKSYCAMEKDKDNESVHFSWGPGRMDVPKRRQPRLFVQ
eukprot:gene24685-33157_t